eukprot:TRINITY_DN22928_c0_g1_i1.p1 TRINITY_DN22928_c0_g1~~TRINITY_DN22928_c0_g1_i1.p1  ORF type:complete len:1099 (+),score=196.54 TRINITY_DN22928_c0_g1_i1:38-3298(+)
MVAGEENGGEAEASGSRKPTPNTIGGNESDGVAAVGGIGLGDVTSAPEGCDDNSASAGDETFDDTRSRATRNRRRFRGAAAAIGDTDEHAAEVQAIIDEINEFRRCPKSYAKELARLQHCYRDNYLTYPDSSLTIETVEGPAALEECLEDLFHASPLPALTLSKALCCACQQHIADLQDHDFCSHIGTDGSTPEERLARYGEHREQCGENVVFGMRSAKETVYHMLIDDGSPERGHRANLLNMDFHFVGAALGRHPSTETANVVLLVDHFRAKQVGLLERKRVVVEEATGKEIADHEGVTRSKTTQKAWDRLMQELKPDHLAVPGRLLDHVHRNVSPALYRDKISRVSKYLLGELLVPSGIDPAIVRAFVHRVDENHDDCIAENELAKLVHQHQLAVTQDMILGMFDEIILRRPWHERHRRSVDWKEIFAAMKAHKKWVPVVDVHIERDADQYQLTVEVEELERRCAEVFAELETRCSGLFPPPLLGSTTNSSLPRNKGGAARIDRLNKFFASLLAATDSGTTELLQQLPVVQSFLGKPVAKEGSSGVAKEIHRAVCMGQRRLWAHTLRPCRDLWLLFFRVVGLHPLVPAPVNQSPTALKEQPLHQHVDAALDKQKRFNVAQLPPKYIGMPQKLATMRMREIPQKVQARGEKIAEDHESTRNFDGSTDISSGATVAKDNNSSSCRAAAMERELAEEREAARLAKTTDPSMASKAVITNIPPWDEKRLQKETLVNGSLLNSAMAKGRSPPVLGVAQTGTEPQLAYTFESKRRFMQINSKQERASEEQSFLGNEKRKLGLRSALSAGRLGGTGGGLGTMGASTASGLGPVNQGGHCHGAGAFSNSAPSGVLGHFHNTMAIHSKHRPQSLDATLDGSHIDHTRGGYQKSVENFGQPAGYAMMPKEERDRQFTTYLQSKKLGAGATDGTHDGMASKCKAAAERRKEQDPYKDWSRPEFRDDVPKRLGIYGRRDFDPQVREKPVRNPHNVSQIEDKPMETFLRQQERVDDFLSRAVPHTQPKKFQQHMPTSEKPLIHQEMSNREPIFCSMNGDQKLTRCGFGQNRHSDQTDFKLYTRPLHSGNLDKLLPIM